MTFKISFKSLTIFAKIPILYAWLDSAFISDAYIFLGKAWGRGVSVEHFSGDIFALLVNFKIAFSMRVSYN